VKLCFSLLFATGLLMASLPAAATTLEQPGTVHAPLAPLDEDGRRDYIIQLKGPSLLAHRRQTVAPAQPKGRSEALDGWLQSETALGLRKQLQHDQGVWLKEAGKLLERELATRFRYVNALNAIAIEITPAEAEQLARMPAVSRVEPSRLYETGSDASIDFVGAPAIWEGFNQVGETRGQGVIIGTIDTGINSEHPSFQGIDHTNPYGDDNYVGWCVANPDFCNNKLIGAWNFFDPDQPPEDTSGHGSHVASTAAGNRTVGEVDFGSQTISRQVSGMAPLANLISYKVCELSCSEALILAAIDQAIEDGVDVINYAISGAIQPWQGSISLAFLEAFEAGIFISAMAGNSGPTPGTVLWAEPWMTSVGASSHDRLFANTLSHSAGLANIPAVAGTGPGLASLYTGELLWAGQVDSDNALGCSSFPPNSFDSRAALIQRGDCPFATKANNAADAGANLLVVYDNTESPPFTMGALQTTTIPAFMVSRQDGESLVGVHNVEGSTVSITLTASISWQPEYANLINANSGRGPTSLDLLGPTLVAPGHNILGADAAEGGTSNRWQVLTGASMSAAHVSGAAALMRALQPDWTPAEIRSALALSANPDTLVRGEDGSTAGTNDQGSGLLDISAASRISLVMNETGANFRAADPFMGGDPRTLNLPHLVDRNCQETCSFTRTIRHVASETLTYSASIDSQTGLSATVTPATFTLSEGQSQTLQIEANVDLGQLGEGEEVFGQLVIVPQGPTVVEDFTGPFAFANWVFSNNPTNVAGSVETLPGPPGELRLTSGNNGVQGATSFAIVVPDSGLIRFDWGFESLDSGTWDWGGVALNGANSVLAYNNTSRPFFIRSAAIPVQAGDSFAFRAFTADGTSGAGTLGITNFRFESAYPTARMPMAIRAFSIPTDEVFQDRFE
jgi:subtilisin family serine protease